MHFCHRRRKKYSFKDEECGTKPDLLLVCQEGLEWCFPRNMLSRNPLSENTVQTEEQKVYLLVLTLLLPMQKNSSIVFLYTKLLPLQFMSVAEVDLTQLSAGETLNSCMEHTERTCTYVYHPGCSTGLLQWVGEEWAAGVKLKRKMRQWWERRWRDR